MSPQTPSSASSSPEPQGSPAASAGRLRRLLRVLRGDKEPLPRCMSEVPGLGYGEAPETVRAMIASGELPPCFFIVGAPRCGTTAVSKVLARNPKISFSKPKETHVFAEPRPGMSEAELGALYVERFHRDLTPEHQAIGDGSVTYLYFPEAIERALRFDPRSKFIVMVRDPVEMMRSYHARMVFQLDEDVEDFAAAWALQERRAAGQDIPRRCRDPRMLQYGQVGRLGEHVERLFETAGRERCKVVVFDDFVQDPRAVYLDLLEFLGVDDDGQSEFRRKRETAGFKSRWLQQFVMNPPPWALRLVYVSDMRMLKRLKRLRSWLKGFNTKPEQRRALSGAEQEMLREYFRADVQRLSRLIGRDLSHWCEASVTSGGESAQGSSSRR